LVLNFQGKKNYDDCQLRGQPVIEAEKGREPRYSAELHCPNPQANGLKTPYERWVGSNDTEQAARRHLRALAATEACGSCTLHNLTRADLLRKQADETNASAELLRAQHNLAEAQKLGAAEVNDINARNLGADATPIHPDQVPPILP
jgi:hypothetical protein